MAALTKTQLEYIKERAQGAHNAYVAHHMAAVGDQPRMPSYSDGEKRDMIRNGTATLKETDGRCYYVTDFFDYPLTAAMTDAQAARHAWADARLRIAQGAAAKLQKVLDEVVVGNDGAAALAKIDETFAT